jgi:hypothetical protein
MNTLTRERCREIAEQPLRLQQWVGLDELAHAIADAIHAELERQAPQPVFNATKWKLICSLAERLFIESYHFGEPDNIANCFDAAEEFESEYRRRVEARERT